MDPRRALAATRTAAVATRHLPDTKRVATRQVATRRVATRRVATRRDMGVVAIWRPLATKAAATSLEVAMGALATGLAVVEAMAALALVRGGEVSDDFLSYLAYELLSQCALERRGW